ncbi:Carboxy-terminal domain (CTD) phosphatase [Rhizophlyctis rosea]|nr:Carboxy-terminal domain (CTD) phosphatase [Rhizophlyctis rosea]
MSSLDLATADLTTADGVKSYLSQTRYKAKTVIPLQGGTASFVFSAELENTVTPCGDAGEEVTSIVVKHAENFAWRQVVLDAKRGTRHEAQSFIRFAALLPPKASPLPVGLPHLYKHDDATNTIIIEHIVNSPTLKQIISSNRLSESDAARVGASLGCWLKRLHSLSGSITPEFKAFLNGNEQWRELAQVREYIRVGGLVEGLMKDEPEERRKEVGKLFGDITHYMQTALGKHDETCTSVMGDFWTGNILVTTNGECTARSIHVIDWGGARWGDKVFDIAQFLAEVNCLDVFRDQSRGKKTSRIVARAFLDAYGVEGLSLEERKRILIQVGVHLICYPPFVPGWGSAEEVRACGLLGLGYVEDRWRGDFRKQNGRLMDGLL